MSHRDYTRQQIIGIGIALESGQPLQREHVRFLIDAGKRAAAGEDDPFGWALPDNRPDDEAHQLAIAKMLHRAIKVGWSKSSAYKLAGALFNLAGTPDGAAAKAYRERRAQLDASDVLYATRRQGTRLTPAESQQIAAALGKTFTAASKRNSRK